jgi:hypothetical protein
MFTESLRATLLGSGAAAAMMAGQAFAGQADDLQAEVDSLRGQLDQLEKQKAAAQLPPAAAPADAVVGGDFPGSWKLPGSDTSMAIHGYIKADFIYDFNSNLGDSFAATTIAGNHSAAANQGGNFHFQSRQSRINFETRTPTDWGMLKTFLEMDFYGSLPNTNYTVGGGGNTSNPLRMRHAYGQLGPVLAGQTWSNFADIEDFAEELDFNGGQGESQARQTQVRYTLPFGKWIFSTSAENANGRISSIAPVTNDTIATTAGTPVGNQTELMPDLTARAQYVDSWGHVSLSGVFRDFNYDNGGNPGNSSTVASEAATVHHTANSFGGGVMLGGNFAVGQAIGGLFAKDRVGFAANWGPGIERYYDFGSLNPLQDAVAVAGPGGSISLKVVTHEGGNVWLQHWWTDSVRTNLVYGVSWWGYPGSVPRVADTGVPATSQIAKLQTAYANLIWSPVKSVNIGLEFMYGDLDKRRLLAPGPCGISQCGGNSGEDKRLMASLQYLF